VFKVFDKTVVRINPFFSLLKVADLPQKPQDAEDAQYIVNGLFGNDDYSSFARILLYTKNKDTKALYDMIISLKL
jgi:hypothetical protein